MDELGPLLLVVRLSLGAPSLPPPLPAPAPAEAGGQVWSASRPPVPGPVAARTATGEANPDRWIAEDKLKHFFMSFALTGAMYGAVRSFGLEGAPGLALAGAGGAAAGVWKEWQDRRAGGPFSRKDLAWDALGIGAALALASQTR
jgi:uncharacterized protein YfiM (DUF2279 family)